MVSQKPPREKMSSDAKGCKRGVFNGSKMIFFHKNSFKFSANTFYE